MMNNFFGEEFGCTIHMLWVILITCVCVVLVVASCSVYQAVQESSAMRDCVARNGMFDYGSDGPDWIRCTGAER